VAGLRSASGSVAAGVRAVVAFYNDAVAEPPALKKQWQHRALTAMTAYLVDPAKAETLRLMDEDNQAADIMAKYAG